jgi:hypothetical protein
MNYAEFCNLKGIPLHQAPLTEGLLQSPEKSKLAKSTQELLMAGKQPRDFVASVVSNEILVAVETLLGAKDVKGLSQTMREKAGDIAGAYLDLIEYPGGESGGDSAPAPAEAPAEPGGEEAPAEGGEGEAMAESLASIPVCEAYGKSDMVSTKENFIKIKEAFKKVPGVSGIKQTSPSEGCFKFMYDGQNGNVGYKGSVYDHPHISWKGGLYYASIEPEVIAQILKDN